MKVPGGIREPSVAASLGGSVYHLRGGFLDIIRLGAGKMDEMRVREQFAALDRWPFPV